MEGKNLQPRKYTPPSKNSPSDMWKKSKAFSQVKVKRTNHQKSNFTTNTKWTFLVRKHKRKKRLTENKPKTIMKMVIESCTVLYLVAQSCPTLGDPMGCCPPGSSVHGDSPGKNTGVDCHALLQGIFPTQGSNPGLPHCRRILYHLSY